MDTAVIIIASFVAGCFTGLMSGILGVGGGLIVIPFCRLVLGLPPIMCTATSLFTIIFTSFSGAMTRVRNKMCIVPLGIAIGLGGAVMSPLGVYLSTLSPGWLIIVVLVCFQIWSIYQMFSKAHKLGKKERETRETSGKFAAAGFDPSAGYQPTRKDLAIGVGIGLLGGLLSGYVGLGGGFVIVPLSCAVLGISLRQMSGTSLIAIIILAIPGVIEHLILGNVAVLSGIAIVAGSIPAAIIGATIAKRIPERQTRIIFGIFLCVVTVLLIVNEFR